VTHGDPEKRVEDKEEQQPDQRSDDEHADPLIHVIGLGGGLKEMPVVVSSSDSPPISCS